MSEIVKSENKMLPKIVSLFCGAGGLDLGFVNAGFDIAFAVDISPSAIRTHKRNFPSTVSIIADLVDLGAEGLRAEVTKVITSGAAIAIIGGPPCQGFSRANRSPIEDDPRNKLPILYLEIVAELKKHYDVQFVLFENVLGIRDTKHEEVFSGILSRLSELELHGRSEDVCALDFGVPQTRHRVIISGFRSEKALDHFAIRRKNSGDLSVSGAIRHLPEPVYFRRGICAREIPYHENHWTMRPVSKRFGEKEAGPSSARSFRRLAWERPSPTVAYGHREIHVHPSGHRRLSIYEAMLLQGFPKGDFFLEGNISEQVEQVSNAVPPPLAEAIAVGVEMALRFESVTAMAK